MKIRFIFQAACALFATAATVATASAQDVRARVCDQEGQPLIGASVYWAGTTVGGSTDVEGHVLLHRVKGYDRLVASYLGYTANDKH